MSAAKSSSSAASSFPRYARVALPLPLVQTFSYGVPRALDALAPGCRVKVRFGPRVLIGCVVQIEDAAPTLPPGTKTPPILGSLDPVPVLGEELLSLAEWIADYYVAPPGEGLRGFLPPDTGRAETVLYRRKTEAAGAAARGGRSRWPRGPWHAPWEAEPFRVRCGFWWTRAWWRGSRRLPAEAFRESGLPPSPTRGARHWRAMSSKPPPPAF